MDVDAADAAAAPQVGETAAAVPDHATTVVVPVANPRTAPELLDLARAVVRGDGGKVLAVVVVRGEAEAEVDRVDQLREVVNGVSVPEGTTIELVTRPAPGVARGILDVAVDEGADMILLGVQAPIPGEVSLGPIAEAILDAAHCDVLIYRRGRQGIGMDEVEGLVATSDGSAAARVGVRLAAILGAGADRPVRVLHVRRPGQTAAAADHALAEVIADLPGGTTCEPVTVNATTTGKGLRTAVSPRELTVVGFDNIIRLDGRHMGATPIAALDALRGPVIVVSRPPRRTGVEALLRRLISLLRPRMTAAEEESLVWHARLQATLTADFVVTCVLSALIASFGLLLNSPAVIIGAMLVAPLMSPLIAFGTALVDGDTQTLRRAAGTVVLGSVVVAATAAVVGLVSGPETPTSEMASRGSPSLVDAGVAIASGMVGAYASARKGIPAALAGVAIAAALVPPICVFGLALFSDAALAGGAGLLFLTNIACMAAAGAAMLLWLGLRVERDAGPARWRYIVGTGGAVLAVMVALVTFGLRGTVQLDRIGDTVAEVLPAAELVEVTSRRGDGTVTVTVLAAEEPTAEQVDALVDQVAAEFDGAVLRLVVQRLLGGS